MTTESRNPNTMHIDKASTIEMLTMMQRENAVAVAAVEHEMVASPLPSIALSRG